MVRIEATIKPFVLERVREALGKLGIQELNEYQVNSFGAERSHQELYRGAEYSVDSVPRIKVDLTVQDHLADQAVAAISASAQTQSRTDGTILVLPVGKIVPIGKAAAQ